MVSDEIRCDGLVCSCALNRQQQSSLHSRRDIKPTTVEENTEGTFPVLKAVQMWPHSTSLSGVTSFSRIAHPTLAPSRPRPWAADLRWASCSLLVASPCCRL